MDEADLARALPLVDSPADRPTLYCMSSGAGCGKDIPCMICSFGPRIHFVHVRNMCHMGPGRDFTEATHPSHLGSLDIFAITEGYYQVGY